jgi:hypothetical protein
MFAVQWRKLWNPLVRRACAGLALVAYLTTVLGVPLPASADKDRRQPYPCMDHPCGCATAEQCWRHCCCFTPEEKFAWAAAHGVAPPAYAEQPSGGWHTVRLRDREAGNSAPEASCCACTRHQADRAAPARDCSENAGCCQAPAQPPAKSSAKASPRSRWVVGVAALRSTTSNRAT